MSEFKDSLGNVMSCDTEPLMDGWGWADYWQCADWITWHKMLKSECGLSTEEANLKVTTAWNSHGLFSHEWFCQFDQEFRDYFISQGESFSFLTNITYNIGVGVESATEALPSVGKYIKYAVPIALMSVAVFYAIRAYKILK